MRFGAALRLLRLGAGLSLRDLSDRLGVSGAYLSRVENGHDAPPTLDRLFELARILGVSPDILVEIAGRLTPTVSRYLEQVPAARGLFREIARRNLSSAQIARLRVILDETFPFASEGPNSLPLLSTFWSDDKVLLSLRCETIEDALALLAARMAPSLGIRAGVWAERLSQKDRLAAACVGGGVMLAHDAEVDYPVTFGWVSLSQPLPAPTPDGQPLQVIWALTCPKEGAQGWLAQAARLLRPENVAIFARARTPAELKTFFLEAESQY